MTVHLIKLCVGIESPEHLAAAQARRFEAAAGESGPRVSWHVTRRMPKRRADLCNGGSLYWVMGGVIRVRQAIVDIREIEDEAGRAACLIELDSELVPVVPRNRRPFQGWRYLQPGDTPPDVAERPEEAPDMPDWMVAELSDLGLL
jgi:hypothetical protein